MVLQRPTTANLAMGPIRVQNAPQLLKLYYENNDLEARSLQRPTAANLTRGGDLALEWSAAFKPLLKKQRFGSQAPPGACDGQFGRGG